MEKYNPTFTKLMSLILNMTAEEQEILLGKIQKMLDNRKKDRKPCLVPAQYSVCDISYYSYILDLNDSGAFIETDEHIPAGQDIKIKYFDPFSRSASEFKGKIVWSNSDGIGVKFTYFIHSPYMGDVTPFQT